MDIDFQFEEHLQPAEFIDLLRRSTLAERRPIDEPDTIEVMVRQADLLLTARKEGKLIGLSRAISDRGYCTYLSDLAVDADYQHQGIGRELIRRTHLEAGLNTTLILLAAPAAREYYPKIGMQAHDSCWIVPRVSRRQSSKHASQSATNASSSLDAIETNQLDSFFDDLASEYDVAIRRCVPRYDEMQATLLGYLPQYEQPPRILELGAGTGALTEKAAKTFPGASICVADLSSESLNICSKRVGQMAHVQTLVGDMRSLDLEQNEFDLVLSSIAIHHLTSPEKQKLFNDCLDWLKPGGIISYCDQFGAPTPEIYAANIDHWHRIALSKGATESEWMAWMEHQDKHDYHDSLGDQMNWLKQAGFEQIDCQWRNLLWTVLTARKPQD